MTENALTLKQKAEWWAWDLAYRSELVYPWPLSRPVLLYEVRRVLSKYGPVFPAASLRIMS